MATNILTSDYIPQIGLYMVVFCSSSALSSTLTGWISGTYGRNVPLIFAFIIDLSQFIFLLLWQPTHGTTWMVFIIALVYGFVDGALQLVVQGNALLKLEMSFVYNVFLEKAVFQSLAKNITFLYS